ncbi:MAG: histidine phosphatase family protein [Candidatus Nealsonbacteria bacterium]|nr:histidine phosphatase family protein [Candidatus Nealsonbacteria bacterium]
MNNRYFLLRHGQNVWQVQKKAFIYPAKTNFSIRLTLKGKKQVKKSIKRIKKEKIDLIYSSDFKRTKETSAIAAKEFGIKKINFDKRLRDINMGIFHGRMKEDYYRFFNYDKKKFSQKPLKGESWTELKKRTMSFLKDLEKKYKNKKILIVGHGDPLWILEGLIKKMSDKKLLKELFVKKNYIQVGELRKAN